MIAVDTNLLVYAHRSDSPWNAAAYALLQRLASRRESWAIPWPCLHEFYAIVTHRKIYAPPSTPEQAIDQIDAWLEIPRLVLLSEEANYWPGLRDLLRKGRVTGPLAHDAKIAALCMANAISELWSADRDFSRFATLRVRNPLVEAESNG